MGTVFRSANLRFCIYTRDHGMPHCHVLGPGAEAKIAIATLGVLENKGFSEKTLRRIVEQVKEYQSELMSQWREYHGEEED